MHDDHRTRRDTLIGMGAATAGLLMPSGLLAQGSDRKLGYAIVGLGGYATRQIMPAFKDCQHSRLVALVSGTPEKLERYGTEYNVPKTHRYSYANYDRIADNPDIDIVYVILPNSMHAEYSIRAARAGKHVMCEKPMAVSAAECQAMIDASAKAKKRLMIGYRSRFQPHNVKAIDLCRTQAIGKLRMLRSAHGFNIQPNQWRLERKLSGGGSLMDIGIYALNAMRYLTGEEPVEISAIESTDRRDPRFATVEDRIDWVMRFPSGVVATCASSYSSGHGEIRVVGTDGFIDLEPATGYEGQKMRVEVKGKPLDPRIDTSGPSQFVGQLDHLSTCIKTGRTPIVSGEEGLKDLRAIEAIYRSAREGRRVTVAA